MASQMGHNIPLKRLQVKVPIGAGIWVLKDKSLPSEKKTNPPKVQIFVQSEIKYLYFSLIILEVIYTDGWHSVQVPPWP